VGPPLDHGNGKFDHKVRQASRFVQMLQHVAQLGGSTPASSARPHGRCLAALRISPSIFTIAGKKVLTVHAKWIGRYDRRGVTLQHGSVLSTRAMRALRRLDGAGDAD
jgi:hypothetical protein